MIGDALKIFEELKLWDDLIHCYWYAFMTQGLNHFEYLSLVHLFFLPTYVIKVSHDILLEKKAAAVELIMARLCEMLNDPRLWLSIVLYIFLRCSFGDVTKKDTHYEKALEVSNNRSARAKRSLARSAYNKGNYEVSKVLCFHLMLDLYGKCNVFGEAKTLIFCALTLIGVLRNPYREAAMALNSLHPDGWFALGAIGIVAQERFRNSSGKIEENRKNDAHKIYKSLNGGNDLKHREAYKILVREPRWANLRDDELNHAVNIPRNVAIKTSDNSSPGNSVGPSNLSEDPDVLPTPQSVGPNFDLDGLLYKGRSRLIGQKLYQKNLASQKAMEGVTASSSDVQKMLDELRL
ncbi:hypothetical protein GIB67_032266 [Kingdonia uniflora]|uniref:Uncharacterized protein n=1 Tax=Kingdonia uniflora TaxID=39325 RepID=A0A7J7MX43_9MAGN|nr:hypothetical protein GIB67_032266 [Kingdonia uniflora]